MKRLSLVNLALVLAVSCSPLTAGNENYFPYGGVPKERPDMELSPAMERIYADYLAVQPEFNERFTNFKYTPITGLDYNNGDGTISRRERKEGERRPRTRIRNEEFF